MSINEEIDRIEENIANTYAQAEEMGAEMPVVRNSNNLASTIATIQGSGSSSSYRKLTPELYEEALASGTYNGTVIPDNEVFTTYKGTFEQFNVGDKKYLNPKSVSRKTLPVPSGTSTMGMGFGCAGNELIISGHPTENGLLAGVSTDGGKTWEYNLNSDILGKGYRTCIYGNGIFITWPYWAESEEDVTIYTTDGLHWNKLPDLPDTRIGIIFCHDKFYVFGTSGEAYYSSDCVTWTAFTCPLNFGWAVASTYDGTNYIIGSSNKVMYSSDGINWTAVSIPGSVTSMASNENAVVISDYSYNRVYYSTNHGVSWNTAALTNPPDAIGMSVVEHNGIFLVGTGSIIEQGLLRSEDGINWTTTQYSVPGDVLIGCSAGFIGGNWISEDGLNLVRTNDSIYSMMGESFCTETSDKFLIFEFDYVTTIDICLGKLTALSYTSEQTDDFYVRQISHTSEKEDLLLTGELDGKKLKSGTKLLDPDNKLCIFLAYEDSYVSLPLSHTSGRLAYGNGMYVLWPSDGLVSAVWHPQYSRDGITWYDCNITTNLACDLIFDGTQFVCNAYDPNTSSKNCIYTSADGIDWTYKGQIASLTYQWWSNIAHKGNAYVCGGSSTSNQTVAYSTDLVSWTTYNVESTTGHYTYANNSVFICFFSNTNSYKYSTSGTSWSTAYLPSGEVYNSAWVAGNYIYCKTKDKLYYTTNGTSWTQFDTSSFTPTNKILYDGTKYYATSSSGVYVSTNGTSGWVLTYDNKNAYTIATPTRLMNASGILEFDKGNCYELYYTDSSTLDKFAGYDKTTNQILKNKKGNFVWEVLEDGKPYIVGTTNPTDSIIAQVGQRYYNSTNKTSFIYTGTIWQELQNKLTAGTGINITDNVISNTGLINTATGTNAITILGTPSEGQNGINLGSGSTAAQQSVAIGGGSSAATCSVALGITSTAAAYATGLGYNADAVASGSIQIGPGTNNDANTLQIGFPIPNAWAPTSEFTLLNSTGLIPVERLGGNSSLTSTAKYLREDGEWAEVQGGSTYTAGTGIDITDNVISNTGLINAATGNNAIAIGVGSTAPGYKDVAIGERSSSDSQTAVAIGSLATITGGGTSQGGIAIGHNAQSTSASNSIALGRMSKVTANQSIGIGFRAESTASGAVQIGQGTNSTEGTLQFRNYLVIDNDGTIPADRLSKSVIVADEEPTPETTASYFGQTYLNRKTGNLYYNNVNQVTPQTANYTVYGSPTIINFIAEGFNGSNYLRSPQAITFTSSDEVKIKSRIYITTSQTSFFINPSSNNSGIGYESGWKICGINGINYKSGSWSAGNWYDIEYTQTGSSAKLYIDGNLIVSASSPVFVTGDYIQLGHNNRWENFPNGKIDLTKTEVLINNASIWKAVNDAVYDGKWEKIAKGEGGSGASYDAAKQEITLG